MEERKRPWPGNGGGDGDGSPREEEQDNASVASSRSEEDEEDKSNEDDNNSDEGDSRKMAALPSSLVGGGAQGTVAAAASASGSNNITATNHNLSNSSINHASTATGSSARAAAAGASSSNNITASTTIHTFSGSSDNYITSTTGTSAGNGNGTGVSESNNNSNNNIGDTAGTHSNSYSSVAVVTAAASGGDDSESKGAKKRMRTAETETSEAIIAAAGQNRVSHEDRWVEMFNRLLTYKEQHGNCRVPNRYPEDSQLGFWVSAQRRQYKIAISSTDGSSALTPERAKKLEEAGFEWSTTNPHHTPWETRYEELVEFVQKYGHAEVPMRWKENPKLSHWVSKQRHDFKLRKQGKSSRLNNKKLKLLNDLGFLWEGSRRSLKEKIAVGGSEDSLAAGENTFPEAPSSQSAINPFGQPANAAAALQAAMGNNATTNPAFLALQQANPGAAAAVQGLQQQQGLPPENLTQILQALGVAQPMQPMFAGMQMAAPANPILNLASANPLQPQLPVDPNNIAVRLNLAGQLLAPLMQQQQHPARNPVQMQQLLLQTLAQQQQQQQQQQVQQPFQILQYQQPQFAMMASAGNQQALTAAIQQAMAGGQPMPLAFGNAPVMAPAAPVANDAMANHLRFLQMAGLASQQAAGVAQPPAVAPPGPPGHQGMQQQQQGLSQPPTPSNTPGNNNIGNL